MVIDHKTVVKGELWEDIKSGYQESSVSSSLHPCLMVSILWNSKKVVYGSGMMNMQESSGKKVILWKHTEEEAGCRTL